MTATPRAPVRLNPQWTVVAVVGWLLTTVVCFGIVAYALGPMLANNDQRTELAVLRDRMAQAQGAARTLLGAAPVTKPPEFGAPVAVLEIPKLQVQQVVLEGVEPGETMSGPGHVPGTSGPGQPGNSAVVGRYSGYGAPFSRLGELAPGDQLVIATTQGKSVYTVTGTANRDLDEDRDYGRTENGRIDAGHIRFVVARLGFGRDGGDRGSRRQAVPPDAAERPGRRAGRPHGRPGRLGPAGARVRRVRGGGRGGDAAVSALALGVDVCAHDTGAAGVGRAGGIGGVAVAACLGLICLS